MPQKYLLSLIFVFLVSACAFETKVPLDLLTYTSPEKNHDKQLVVLLRGFGNGNDYFEKLGWIDQLQNRHPSYDVIVPDLHYGYYREDSFIQRLNEDVIMPAKKKGYTSIWLLGISMGGLGTIMTSEKFSESITRIFLIAPYLGDGLIQKEIEKSGSLKKWNMQSENQSAWQFKLWAHLKSLSMRKKVPVYLGYGVEDKMPGLNFLHSALPREQIVTVDGGHKDIAFTRIFEQMLNKGYFMK